MNNLGAVKHLYIHKIKSKRPKHKLRKNIISKLYRQHIITVKFTQKNHNIITLITNLFHINTTIKSHQIRATNLSKRSTQNEENTIASKNKNINSIKQMNIDENTENILDGKRTSSKTPFPLSNSAFLFFPYEIHSHDVVLP